MMITMFAKIGWCRLWCSSSSSWSNRESLRIVIGRTTMIMMIMMMTAMIMMLIMMLVMVMMMQSVISRTRRLANCNRHLYSNQLTYLLNWEVDHFLSLQNCCSHKFDQVAAPNDDHFLSVGLNWAIFLSLSVFPGTDLSKIFHGQRIDWTFGFLSELNLSQRVLEGGLQMERYVFLSLCISRDWSFRDLLCLLPFFWAQSISNIRAHRVFKVDLQMMMFGWISLYIQGLTGHKRR